LAFRPCLLIPCYNHGRQIGQTLSALAGYGLSCLLVDDGSEASTAAELERLAAQHNWVQLIRLPRNQGKGVAVAAGLTAAKRQGFSHALQIDADGQHDTRDISKLLAAAEVEPDALISGQPSFGSDMPRSRRYGRHITHFWVWIETLSLDIRDSMCGFRVYPVAASVAVLRGQRIGRRMDFDTDIMVRLYWSGTPVRFVPTHVIYPADGESRFAPFMDNVRISWMHTRLVCGMLLRLPKLLSRRWAGRRRVTE
jgi:glycosyltransferase involved in cell wall biosynthesis